MQSFLGVVASLQLANLKIVMGFRFVSFDFFTRASTSFKLVITLSMFTNFRVAIKFNLSENDYAARAAIDDCCAMANLILQIFSDQNLLYLAFASIGRMDCQMNILLLLMLLTLEVPKRECSNFSLVIQHKYRCAVVYQPVRATIFLPLIKFHNKINQITDSKSTIACGILTLFLSILSILS